MSKIKNRILRNYRLIVIPNSVYSFRLFFSLSQGTNTTRTQIYPHPVCRWDYFVISRALRADFQQAFARRPLLTTIVLKW